MFGKKAPRQTFITIADNYQLCLRAIELSPLPEDEKENARRDALALYRVAFREIQKTCLTA
jgi:hypothetical protein